MNSGHIRVFSLGLHANRRLNQKNHNDDCWEVLCDFSEKGKDFGKLLTKLNQLFHAAAFLTTNVRHFFSSSPYPEGSREPAGRRPGRGLLPVRLKMESLRSLLLLAGGAVAPCAETGDTLRPENPACQLLKAVTTDISVKGEQSGSQRVLCWSRSASGRLLRFRGFPQYDTARRIRSLPHILIRSCA